MSSTTIVMPLDNNSGEAFDNVKTSLSNTFVRGFAPPFGLNHEQRYSTWSSLMGHTITFDTVFANSIHGVYVFIFTTRDAVPNGTSNVTMTAGGSGGGGVNLSSILNEGEC